MSSIIVPQILKYSYPVDSRLYRNAHRRASRWEKKKFGFRRYRELMYVIGNVIPKGELAGSHDKAGNTYISVKVPQRYWEQIEFHEQMELEFMADTSRAATIMADASRAATAR